VVIFSLKNFALHEISLLTWPVGTLSRR
jgi:hypothetical protein